MQPTKLLQYFRMVGVAIQHALVCRLCSLELLRLSVSVWPFLTGTMRLVAYIFLLFVNVADLEPNVFLGKGTRWVVDDVFEALEKCQ